MALRRGMYRELITGDLFWLLYELDGHVNVQHKRTGKVVRVEAKQFALFFQWHSEVTHA